MVKFIRSPKGEGRREVDLEREQIPDLWHCAMYLQSIGETIWSAMVLDTWYFAHDMRNHIIETERSK